MSGTSCDGLSGALVRFRARRFELLAWRNEPYPAPLPELLLRSRELPVSHAARLDTALGELSAALVARLLKRARIPARRVSVIGSHGHTFYHGPDAPFPCTLQLGNASVIAQRTGIPVAHDFRRKDVAAGGQGAPLIPYFDQYFFGGGQPTALQNIGGIANVTLVGRGIQPVAFDTGPGNCLIDRLAQRLSRGRHAFDPGGRLARRGRIDAAWLRRLHAHPFFRKAPPKSTGVELFNEGFLDARLGAAWRKRLPDALATVTRFTAESIARAYERWLPRAPRRVIFSGGGVRNVTLMDHLREVLAPAAIESVEDHGLPAQAKEPVAFAFLALRALQRRPNHLPETTGATRRCILGALELPS